MIHLFHKLGNATFWYRISSNKYLRRLIKYEVQTCSFYYRVEDKEHVLFA